MADLKRKRGGTESSSQTRRRASMRELRLRLEEDMKWFTRAASGLQPTMAWSEGGWLSCRVAWAIDFEDQPVC